MIKRIIFILFLALIAVGIIFWILNRKFESSHEMTILGSKANLTVSSHRKGMDCHLRFQSVTSPLDSQPEKLPYRVVIGLIDSTGLRLTTGGSSSWLNPEGTVAAEANLVNSKATFSSGIIDPACVFPVEFIFIELQPKQDVENASMWFEKIPLDPKHAAWFRPWPRIRGFLTEEQIRKSKIEILTTNYMGGMQNRIILDGSGKLTIGRMIPSGIGGDGSWQDEVHPVTGDAALLLYDVFNIAVRDELPGLPDKREENVVDGGETRYTFDLDGKRDQFTMINAFHEKLLKFGKRVEALRSRATKPD